MRILIDTNIFIPLEPSSVADVEPGTRLAARFGRLASLGGAQLLVHPDSLVDVDRDRDEDRRALRRELFGKYPVLEAPPGITPELEDLLGRVKNDSNDWVDHRLLAAVHADAVFYLVTEDAGLHRKARRLDVDERVLTIEDATALVESLTDQPPRALPSVNLGPLHSIDSGDPILQSLRQDYGEFDTWLARSKREGRKCLAIRGQDGQCAAICVLKPDDDEFGWGGRVLKLSTFKVADEHAGNRFGELLLKAVFDFAAVNRFRTIWLTAFEKHAALLSMLEVFGFEPSDHKTDLGELVMEKTLAGDVQESVGDPFQFHRSHGPPAVCLGQDREFIVPIQPQFHQILFPELADRIDWWRSGQAQLDIPSQVPAPFGNAIRKAYLSNATVRSLEPGNLLYFYRSDDLRAVTTIGVVEDTLVSDSVEEIAHFVGGRTVYSFEQIRHLARKPVLSILFRQDRHLDPPIGIDQLVANGAIKRAPQSTSTIRTEGIEWLRTQVRR